MCKDVRRLNLQRICITFTIYVNVSFRPVSNHSLYLIKLHPSSSYPKGNFGGNQLVDGSISLSPIPKFDDRFARQNRYELPPVFPLPSPYSGIVHHLSGPNRYALTQTFLRVE